MVCLVFTACRRIAVKQLRRKVATVHRRDHMKGKRHFYSRGRKKAMKAFTVSIQIEATAAVVAA